MKNFVIIVLIIGIIAGTGYGVYAQVDAYKKKHWTEPTNNVEEEPTVPEVKELSVENSLVISLMDKTNVLNDPFVGEEYFGYFYRNDKYSLNTISNQVKLFLAFNSITKSETDDKVEVTQTEIEQELQEIFGSQVTFEHESILGTGCAFPTVTYDAEEGIYTQELPEGCGGIGIPYIASKVESAKEYSDRVEVVEMIAYIDFETEEETLISQVHKTVEDENVIGNLEVDEVTNELEDVFTKYGTELNRYRYTYYKENNNYHLHSVELVK